MHTPHPRRAQVTGDMFHPVMPANAHWAGRQRPHLPESPFANPHPVDNGRKTPCPVCGVRHTLAESLSLYRQHLDENPDLECLAAAVDDDTPFACRCPLDQPCHVDELLNRADKVTIIALGDGRDTTHIVQTVRVHTGECTYGHGSCRKSAIVAVRNTLDQQRPTEVSTLRVMGCADHQDSVLRARAMWEASARELQDPVKRAEFLAEAGVTV